MLGATQTEHSVTLNQDNTEDTVTVQSRNIKSEDMTTKGNSSSTLVASTFGRIPKCIFKWVAWIAIFRPFTPNQGASWWPHPLRRMSPLELETLCNTINDLSALGLIRLSGGTSALCQEEGWHLTPLRRLSSLECGNDQESLSDTSDRRTIGQASFSFLPLTFALAIIRYECTLTQLTRPPFVRATDLFNG